MPLLFDETTRLSFDYGIESTSKYNHNHNNYLVFS